ncbi:ABC transporter ATP-binding protein [Anthocerotibacter panamensis]|uniref:ABC transporter ATP-binding protein n=1 Tax=Anthocerotibacter panamensis TaxID=2857077 RepID=UPI001FDA6C29|nr:ABC transporter ATP-binding protein [Anthocerotibacter panamensis]
MVESTTLSLRKVTKVFGQGKDAYTAVQDLSLEVAANQFVAIVGPSGCGKTTLLNILAGLTPCTDGEVLVGGKPVRGPGPDRGVIFQNYALLPWLTVEENLLFALETVTPGKDKAHYQKTAQHYIALVNLSAARKRYPRELSGGMKQRVGIARAFAINPQILLMDEPFGALDALTRAFLQDEVERIWEQDRKTCILITHDIEEALLLADRIVLMTKGPAAGIAEVIPVPFARPRNRERVGDDQEYLKLRNRLLGHLTRQTREIEEARAGTAVP